MTILSCVLGLYKHAGARRRNSMSLAQRIEMAPRRSMLWLRSHRPDVLLLDLRMPGMSWRGRRCMRSRRHAIEACGSIILTNYETDEDIYRAVQAGAQGYLLKNTSLKRDGGSDTDRTLRSNDTFPRHIASRLGRTHGAYRSDSTRTRNTETAIGKGSH